MRFVEESSTALLVNTNHKQLFMLASKSPFALDGASKMR